jgi:uncharacterized protein YdiU (UPF0061 family)
MAAGFCHGVLNTDNMSITGESFDYGPYAFIPVYDPLFTAAYFDYSRRYCYGEQPNICQLNLAALQEPLQAVIDPADMGDGLAKFDEHYQAEYRKLMLKKLGFSSMETPQLEQLLKTTIRLLKDTQVGYHDFFCALSQAFSPKWRDDASSIVFLADVLPSEYLEDWRKLYQQILIDLPLDEMNYIAQRLQHNPKTVLLRPVIESIWEPITNEDNWEPFNNLVRRIQFGE